MAKIVIEYTGTITGLPGYCGWPTVISPDGKELLAVFSGGRERHVCPFGRIMLIRSADGGHSWSEVQMLSRGPLDDRDAGICMAPDGSLLVNYFTNILALSGKWENMPESWRDIARDISLAQLNHEHGFWMKRSTDNGKTWSEKYSLPVNNPHGPTVMQDGSLLLVGRRLSASAAYQYEGSRLGNEIAAAKSFDNGQSWQVISTLPVASGHHPAQCFEPHAIEMADGRIIASLRDQNRYPDIRTWLTTSDDGGKTWSEPVEHGRDYPVHFLRISENRLLMTCGRRNGSYGVVARISGDCGRSWSSELEIYKDGASADLGYPTTAQMADGTLFTLWYELINDRAVLRYCRWCLEK
ncbi:MAG: exo-alpha-sialidase [Lentisphaeria bacterium]|nr:exo-alpha-sialidase [Lentisphaeria bacterium]